MPDYSNYITVCELMGSHGVKGYIKARPLTHDPERHKLLKAVVVEKVNGQFVELEVEDSKLAGALWHLKFKGFDTPESLRPLVNGNLMVSPDERIPAPEGEFYLDDLAGFAVKLTDGRTVGEVLEVQELPTVDAFLIKFAPEAEAEFSKKTILAPWIEDCVSEIDEENQAIICDGDYLRALCPEERPASPEARQ